SRRYCAVRRWLISMVTPLQEWITETLTKAFWSIRLAMISMVSLAMSLGICGYRPHRPLGLRFSLRTARLAHWKFLPMILLSLPARRSLQVTKADNHAG